MRCESIGAFIVAFCLLTRASGLYLFVVVYHSLVFSGQFLYLFAEIPDNFTSKMTSSLLSDEEEGDSNVSNIMYCLKTKIER